MKNNNKVVFASAFTAVLALGIAGPSASAQNVTPKMKGSADIAVVVNTKNTVNELTTSDLGSIVRGDRRYWTGKESIRLIMRLPGSRERERPLALLKMSNADFTKTWIERVFRGETNSEPTAVPSSGMASQFVRDSSGAITFVVAHDIPPDVKVLKIDGKLPGAPDYPLK